MVSVFRRVLIMANHNCLLPRRHWSIGLLYDFHTVTSTLKKRSPDQPFTPLRLILHLAAPPTDRLLLSPSVEACKQAFMGQLKEADFLRWGNTKRMTGLRQAEQDGIWEAIRDRTLYLLAILSAVPSKGLH